MFVYCTMHTERRCNRCIKKSKNFRLCDWTFFKNFWSLWNHTLLVYTVSRSYGLQQGIVHVLFEVRCLIIRCKRICKSIFDKSFSNKNIVINLEIQTNYLIQENCFSYKKILVLTQLIALIRLISTPDSTFNTFSPVLGTFPLKIHIFYQKICFMCTGLVKA